MVGQSGACTIYKGLDDLIGTQRRLNPQEARVLFILVHADTTIVPRKGSGWKKHTEETSIKSSWSCVITWLVIKHGKRVMRWFNMQEALVLYVVPYSSAQKHGNTIGAWHGLWMKARMTRQKDLELQWSRYTSTCHFSGPQQPEYASIATECILFQRCTMNEPEDTNKSSQLRKQLIITLNYISANDLEASQLQSAAIE
jgi:hypothetical protein